MTEAEWLACGDSYQMLKELRGTARPRKFRLLACACTRQIWVIVKNRESRKAVEIAERFADGQVSDRDRAEARRKTHGVFRVGSSCPFNPAYYAAGRNRDQANELLYCLGGCVGAARAAELQATGVYGSADEDAQRAQSGLIRELFGNPFHPVVPFPVSAHAVSIAHAAYEERELPSGHLDNARLAILSDALEEAGCTDEAILSHLRSPGPHVRGCWALDLVLGKE